MAFSNQIFFFLVLFVAIQRLAEVFYSRSNERALTEKGAKEFGREHLLFMKIMHGSWLVFLIFENWLFPKPNWPFSLTVFFFLLFTVGQLFRITAIKTLGERWTINVMILPGTEAVSKGIYKYLKHPNYYGVIIEIFALPLIAGHWMTALIFTVVNGVLLRKRIKIEEDALKEFNDYSLVGGSRGSL